MPAPYPVTPAPYHLAGRITMPDGIVKRWSEDEPKAHNVFSDFTCSDEIPGGYKDTTGTLARDPRKEWTDIVPYAEMEISLDGGEKIWEGSLDKGPDQSGDQTAITPSGLGFQAIIEDQQAATFGGIDTDLSKWGSPSTQRTIELLAALFTLEPSPEAGFQDASTVLPAIIFAYQRLTKGNTGNEAWYYGGGVDIGKLMFNFRAPGTDAAWNDIAFLLNNSDTSFIFSGESQNADQTTDFNADALHEKVELIASGAGRKYAMFQTVRNQGESELDPYRGIHRWEVPKVLGRHGLEPQGTWPEIGFTAKQILEYIIPLLGSPLTVDPNYIDDDGFVITQAWYDTPGPLADIINDVVKYGFFDWFVYHGKRFEYRIPGSYGRFWKATTKESELSELGIDSQRLWRSIIVTYTDATGKARTVGPLGSGCDVETEALEITDPDHPAVKANRTRRDVLDFRGQGTPEGATKVGSRFLEEANLLNTSGSATLTGWVMSRNGVMFPACYLKSGDYVSFIDSHDQSYRKVVNKTYTHSEKSVQIDVDAPPSGLEALLERLQVGLISLGVS